MCLKTNSNNKKVRYLLEIEGIVQGVGFRPFVYNKATEFYIKGYVKNKGGTVEIDLEGYKKNVKRFILEVIKRPPPLSKIERINCEFLKTVNYPDFIIKDSSIEKDKIKFISPDIAICDKCIKEIMTKENKRYKYAFTNCTDCGARYSIIKSLPYDRFNTTMKNFNMCSDCEKEYKNPANRRFHAEPNCCSTCGPSLALLNNNKQVISFQNKDANNYGLGKLNYKVGDDFSIYNLNDEVHNNCALDKFNYENDPIYISAKLIKEGYILALKGIGGFHLICNGKDEKAIDNLRKRKKRPHKPLAIMCRDLETVKKFCYVSKLEENILKGNKKPIILLEKKFPDLLPNNIAPLNKKLGVMLPYTPLHYLLFQEGIDVIIATSGNISGNPIEYKNEEALNNLKGVADYFLIHNRDIYVPIDDSVVKVINNKETLLRIGRGYAPYITNTSVKKQLIAMGAEEKNTFCLSKKGYTYMSQYIGDLKNIDCYNRHLQTTSHLKSILNITPKICIEDLHPNYIKEHPNLNYNKKIEVQHHHAHMASCMTEHSLFNCVIGVIFDGTGFGLDESIWGGEFFIGDRYSFKRVAHLKKVKIQGGDKSIKEPWRCAVSYLYSIGYKDEEIIKNIEKGKIEVVKKALDKGLNCYECSSMGRFFDAIASIIGIRNNISYDGQGAIELENIIEKPIDDYYNYEINKINDVFQIDYKNIILEVIEDLKKKESLSNISCKFHNAICNATCEIVYKIKSNYKVSKKHSISYKAEENISKDYKAKNHVELNTNNEFNNDNQLNNVVLSGGVFQNNYLLKSIYDKLTSKGFNVFFNEKIPINDEGISFGQLAIGDAIIEKENL